VLAGSYQDASLDGLDRATVIKLLSEIDDDSRDLLAAYLDRREPGWRENARHDAGAGAGARSSGAGKMTEEEAYQILGISPGASAFSHPNGDFGRNAAAWRECFMFVDKLPLHLTSRAGAAATATAPADRSPASIRRTSRRRTARCAAAPVRW